MELLVSFYRLPSKKRASLSTFLTDAPSHLGIFVIHKACADIEHTVIARSQMVIACESRQGRKAATVVDQLGVWVI